MSAAHAFATLARWVQVQQCVARFRAWTNVVASGAYRVAVVGARRRRQGTGEYVAREFARQGCEVSAIVGTTDSTLASARAALQERYGIRCRGFLSLDALLREEPVDIVAICSPVLAHLSQLECAAAAGKHVFCEKPLWWSDELLRVPDAGACIRDRTERLIASFRTTGRYLALNAQWPHTLAAFRELHPQARLDPLEHFRMCLSPVSRGREMLIDSGSHLLSMLRALAGPGQLRGVRVHYQPPAGREQQHSRLLLECVYRHDRGTAAVEFALTQYPDPPRPAGYSINGFAVRRHVEMPAYLISFKDRDRSVPVPDPLAVCVQDFVQSVRAGRLPDSDALVDGMTQLYALVTAGQGEKG